MVKPETQRINLYLTVEAVELLAQMTTENRRGRLVSELIKREAVARGLLVEEVAEEDDEIGELRRRLDALRADLDALAQKRAASADDEQEG